MKQFPAIWNEAFPDAAARKLGIEAIWEPADELPAATEPLAVELRWQGEWDGHCVLIGAGEEITRWVEQTPPEAPRDDLPAQWLKWLQETVEAMTLPARPSQIKLVEKPRGVPLIPYVLRAGERTAHLAMWCEIKTGATQDAGASASAEGGNQNFDLLLDIEVDVSLRFGSRELAIRELLATGPGDVLELDRTISDPVDLVVGDKIVARGEVVLVNGNFGLRVTEVAEPKKRLESVRCLF